MAKTGTSTEKAFAQKMIADKWGIPIENVDWLIKKAKGNE